MEGGIGKEGGGVGRDYEVLGRGRAGQRDVRGRRMCVGQDRMVGCSERKS